MWKKFSQRLDGSPLLSRSTPPVWAGCDLFAWGRLLARHGFAVHPSRWHLVALCTLSSFVQTALGLTQQLVHGSQVRRTRVRHAPVIVLGHWRSGTTLFHELLACDPRHAAPTTYDCFNPHHFLLTRTWLPSLLHGLVPVRRPMDAMAAGWDRPQEDEFALALLGQPSPYEWIAFSNRTGIADAALDFRGCPPGTVRNWQRALLRHVKALTFANGGKRLVLKSPPHTARIPMLLDLFPDARFVHIVRNPYAVYSSTLNLWRVLSAAHGLQRPTWAGMDESILATFSRLHQAFEDGRRLLAPGQLHELRYEDLVQDPLARLEAAYRDLDLGGLEPARRSVEEYLARVSGHERSKHALTAAERMAINERWGFFFRQYGYPLDEG